MHKILENGCKIIRGQGVEVGLMPLNIPGKSEAWLYWLEGQSITSERGWNYCTKVRAIQQINTWLEGIGLALENGQIVLH